MLASLLVDMGEPSPSGPAAGSARILLALRHALADPLSSAALKLDLVERRLLTASGADPSWVVEKVRAAQVDVGTANRLIDVLLRLAEIDGEIPGESTLDEVCRAAGVALAECAAAARRVTLRPRASADAVQSVASFAAGRGGSPRPIARASLENGRVTLAVEGSAPAADGRLERLLELPHGILEAEALFVARAAAEADGGRLELAARDGRFVALLSWPVERKGGA